MNSGCWGTAESASVLRWKATLLDLKNRIASDQKKKNTTQLGTTPRSSLCAGSFQRGIRIHAVNNTEIEKRRKDGSDDERKHLVYVCKTPSGETRSVARYPASPSSTETSRSTRIAGVNRLLRGRRAGLFIHKSCDIRGSGTFAGGEKARDSAGRDHAM